MVNKFSIHSMILLVLIISSLITISPVLIGCGGGGGGGGSGDDGGGDNATCTDSDNDSYFAQSSCGTTVDCNDSNSSINPGASETCNGIDDNCNSVVDEGVTIKFYQDNDGDGYGNPLSTNHACTAPFGYVLDNTDCDDNAASTYPGATEICDDGIDQDCNGSDLICSPTTTYYRDFDNDGYGNPDSSVDSISKPPGYVADGNDCNDSDSGIHPNATEICTDSKDNDCDGFIDCNDNGCNGDPACISSNIAVFGTATFDGGYVFDE